MATNIASPERWAREVPPGDLCFADVDLYVFKEQRKLLRALGRIRRDAQENQRSGLEVTLVIVKIVILFAPVAGLAVFGGPIADAGGSGSSTRDAEPLSRGLAVPIAMWSFIVATLGPVILVREWWTANDRRIDTLALASLVGAIVCGVLTLVGLTGNGWVSLFSGTTAPIWLTIALAGIALATIALASGGRLKEATKDFPTVRRPDYAKLDALISELHEHDVEILLGKRQRILQRLRKRDLIDDARFEAVAASPLGTGHEFD